MAIIRVYRDEAGGDAFPPMCMRCGAEAERRVPQKFAWMPGWVHVFILIGLLPWLLAALITRRTMWVYAPMCLDHVHHWRNRKLYIGLGLLGFIAAGIALAAFADELPQDTSVPAFAALAFGALLWLIVGLILVHGAIRAAEIRDTGIEIANVNRDFALQWRMECERNDGRSRPRSRRPARARAVPPWERGSRGGDAADESPYPDPR